MTKKELVAFVKHQINVDITNNQEDIFNKKRNILYTEIPEESIPQVLSLLHRKGLAYQKHMKNMYWINLKIKKAN